MPKTISPVPALPAPRTKAAKAEEARFKYEYAKQLRRAAETVALTVLVWGPNVKLKSAAATKRKEIRLALKKEGHNALFSEDIAPDPNVIVSEKTKEFAQAKAAHLIIILLEGAPGALAEAHDFVNHPDLAHKCIVMVPVEYKDGYSANGAIRDLQDAYGGVYWYEAADLKACNVLARALRVAEARRQIIYRHKEEQG